MYSQGAGKAETYTAKRREIVSDKRIHNLNLNAVYHFSLHLE